MFRCEVRIPVDSGVAYTPPFAAPEKLAAQFNVEQNTALSGTLTVTPQHSGDGGMTWNDKTALTLTSSGSYAANAITALYGGDDGSTPHQGLMRLKLSGTRATNVRVFLHGRGRARPRHRLVYDGVVPQGAVYSQPFPIEPGNRASVHALVTPVGAATTPSITAQLEISEDGNNWANQTTPAEINATSVSVRVENPLAATLDISRAKGSIGRVRILTGGGSADNANYVRLYVTTWMRPPKPRGGATRISTADRDGTPGRAALRSRSQPFDQPIEPRSARGPTLQPRRPPGAVLAVPGMKSTRFPAHEFWRVLVGGHNRLTDMDSEDED